MGAQVDEIVKLELGSEVHELHRVMPAQVPAFWPVTKQAIALSMPPTETVDEQMLASIMRKIMGGEMVLWLLVRKEEGKELGISMVLLLAFTAQLGFEGYKNLLVYALASMDDSISEKTWVRVYEALLEYGKMTECKKLCGVSSDPQLLALFQRLQPGLNIERRELTMDLEG